MVLGQLNILWQIMNLDLDFTRFIRIYLKHFINLNLKAKTIKLLEENIGGHLSEGDKGSNYKKIKPTIENV